MHAYQALEVLVRAVGTKSLADSVLEDLLPMLLTKRDNAPGDRTEDSKTTTSELLTNEALRFLEAVVRVSSLAGVAPAEFRRRMASYDLASLDSTYGTDIELEIFRFYSNAGGWP